MAFHFALRRCVRTATVLVGLAACCSGLALSRSATAQVILSEVMFRPTNGNANSEWVEIFNTGSSTIDLSGWQFGRPSQSAWSSAFPAGTTLGANQALVITPSASTLTSDWGGGINHRQVSSFPSLPDDPSGNAGRIAIRNGAGVIQDEVTYASSGWPNIGAPNASHSIYVLPQHLSASGNNSGNNWGISTAGLYGGTWRGDNHASPGVVATTPQAAFAPSPDAVWSMVVLPDTQNYVERTHAYHIFQGQTNWIKNNKDLFNIQAVLHEGDIVNRNSGTASNGVTAVQQWQRARDAMSTLDGVVPYIMATGNHDYGTTNSQTRDTKLNTYFKANQNPLVNPATGGILKGTMNAGELQNAYYEFTAPDGRNMLILSLEFWARNSAVNWAKGIAEQPQYADHTAVLLTHSHITPNNGFWTTGANAYQMDGGNDGQDVWNKLLKVAPNFEMTFSGHLGGDESGYRVDKNNAGGDVHQMFFNTQQESNAGNGWLRVIEFLADGKTARVRSYSPHFDLYRTGAQYSYDITLSQIVAPPTTLVWNVNSGDATSMTAGFAASNGNGGVGVSPASPWDSPYNNGKLTLLIGYNGNATFGGSANRTIGSLRVGTNQANSIIFGRNGNGALTASGSVGLVVSSTDETPGDVVVGEGGFSGAMNWNSSGTLEVQGKLRVGQGGTGTFNQTAGIVIGGNTAGASKFIGIGVGAGSNGTYNLDGGFLRPSGGFAGTQFRQTLVGDDGATGELNVGDGVGAPNTAVLESNDDLIVGRGGGTGTLRVRNDGRVELRTSSNPAEFRVGQSAAGTVLQTGGAVRTDDLVLLGSGSGGVGHYAISGGSLSTATDGGGSFRMASAGGVGTLQVSGSGSVTHGAELYLATEADTGGVGRLEIIGHAAVVQIGQLENDAGLSETIRWEASALGVSPLIVTGSGPSSHHVQLQDPAELAANTGAGPTLAGDGVALSLDLSLLSGSQTLTLIDNRSTQPITGFFEDASTGDLYEEGSPIFGTGFDGTVTISYVGSSGVGSTGNDVVLHLAAAVVDNADFDNDGDVDGADFLIWQRNVGTSSGASLADGDADGNGAVNGADLDAWKDQFGPSGQPAQAPVPEPGGIALALALGAGAGCRRVSAKRR